MNLLNLWIIEGERLLVHSRYDLGRPSALLLFFALSLAVSPLAAQPLPIANSSFEEGQDHPAGWTLSNGAEGFWLDGDAASGQRAIALRGDGQSTSYWRSAAIDFAPSRLYALYFSARSIDGKSGAPMSGPRFCNRDIGDLPQSWSSFRSIFFTPAQLQGEDSWLRFGQWRVEGSLAFDALRIVPVEPIYAQHSDIKLGEGENIKGTLYRFTAPFNSPARNHSRPLSNHRCDFNTNRWVFANESEVVYRHTLANRMQLSAKIGVGIGHYESGSLLVEASSNGQTYFELGLLSSSKTQHFTLIDTLLPAASIWVRLRSVSNRQLSANADPGAFQVVSYSYEADISGAALDIRGSTRYAAIEEKSSDIEVSIHTLGDAIPGGDNRIELSVATTDSQTPTIIPQISVTTRDTTKVAVLPQQHLHPGSNEVTIPYTFDQTGPTSLALSWAGEVPFKATIDLHIPALYASSYGRVVPGSTTDVALWSADSAWKISRHRPVPTAAAPTLYLSAAAAESEALQLVLSPRRELHNFHAYASDLTNESGRVLSADQVELLRVDYVSIDQPTDESGAADLWPDPLPALPAFSTIAGGINQPLWIRVNVPRNALPGIYRGHIELRAENYRASVPVALEVYGFALPQRMSCSTALGFSFDEVVRYHNLSTQEQKRQVLDLYFSSFASHHISPYEPAPLDPLSVSWHGVAPTFNWDRWDSAVEHALKTYGFNSFRLRLLGLGGGSFQSRREPQLNGFAENTPEYELALGNYLGAIEQHIGEKGWLEEAFIYWFDEPRKEDYAFVNKGFAKLKRHAPSLRRMLTEQVEDELIGGPTIWCPVTPNFTIEQRLARPLVDESFWWYLCTVPKTPYATLFIDHGGIELRTWLWQTWQNGIDGILVWQSNYWHSDAAYVDSRQNPYEDAMSWMSSTNASLGTKRPWGNGDGRLIYPPLKSTTLQGNTPLIEGPVASQRWEMLRDGIEDYEYFAILRRLLAQENELSAATRAYYENLLLVPAQVSQSSTSFGIQPAPILAHRHALARAIEALSAQAPQ